MEESVLFANGAILDMLSDVCFFFLPPSVKMELDVLRSSGHSFNVSAAELRLKRQQKEKIMMSLNRITLTVILPRIQSMT